MNSALDQIVAEMARDFVKRLGALNEEPYIREAIMKMALREVAWAMLETFGDQMTLADQLRTMGDLIEEHKEEEG